jgi:DNA-binding CsgD family transcriptional regulator
MSSTAATAPARERIELVPGRISPLITRMQRLSLLRAERPAWYSDAGLDAHEQAFREWLRLAPEGRAADLRLYLENAEAPEEDESFDRFIPEGATGNERELFARLMRSTLAALSRPCLSPRELEILGLIGRGMTTKEIAGALALSCHTVAYYRKSLCRKLGVHSTAELASFGARTVCVRAITPTAPK